MDECSLCKISENIIPSFKIYEDEDIVCVLNIFPVNPGHIMIFPRKHVEKIELVDDGTIAKMIVLAKRLIMVLDMLLKPLGYIVMINTYREYERTKHVYLEIIPRFEEDGVKMFLPRKKAEYTDLENIRRKILEYLSFREEKKEEKKEIEAKKDHGRDYDIEEMLKWLRKEI